MIDLPTLFCTLPRAFVATGRRRFLGRRSFRRVRSIIALRRPLFHAVGRHAAGDRAIGFLLCIVHQGSEVTQSSAVCRATEGAWGAGCVRAHGIWDEQLDTREADRRSLLRATDCTCGYARQRRICGVRKSARWRGG
jgi:hypothetical protein